MGDRSLDCRNARAYDTLKWESIYGIEIERRIESGRNYTYTLNMWNANSSFEFTCN